MEQEIQVVLSELIKAISRPDWWTIVITVVNAAIMVGLGWRCALPLFVALLGEAHTNREGYIPCWFI